MNWNEKVVLVTGGTGSFGKKFIDVMLKEYHPAKLIVFSRDELKQPEMRTSGFDQPSLRYFIGDVRDLQRLRRAMHGVNIVIHAAALKQVPACEYNPMEAIKTNILGSSNVIEAALDAGVEKVMALSTDRTETSKSAPDRDGVKDHRSERRRSPKPLRGRRAKHHDSRGTVPCRDSP